MKNEFNLSKKMMGCTCGDCVCMKPKDVKECFQLIKKDWKEKCNRMEVMSGDVAIFELNEILENKVGEKLLKQNHEQKEKK